MADEEDLARRGVNEDVTDLRAAQHIIAIQLSHRSLATRCHLAEYQSAA